MACRCSIVLGLQCLKRSRVEHFLLKIIISLFALPVLATAQTGSKLGNHHILTYTGPAASINAAGPAIIKTLEVDGTMMSAIADAKAANPSCISVVRIFTTKSYSPATNPTAAANDFWNTVLAPPLNALSPAHKALIDYVEGPNEGNSTPTWGSASDTIWFNDFWVALAPLIANAGFKPCGFSIAVGNPGGTLQQIEDTIDLIVPALTVLDDLNGAWSYHAYTGLYTTDVPTERFWSLRYRLFYEHFANDHPHLVDLPILLTEGGVDTGGNPSTSGWIANGTQQQYENWLTWFDARIQEDPQVLGCTLFQSGGGGWPSFDTDPVAPHIVNLINNTPGGPPSAPTGVNAAAGDAQVTVTWNTTPGASNYDVKRSLTSGGPYTVVANDITPTSFVNTGLTNGVTYYYVVSAANGQGQSGNSVQVSATPVQGPSNLIMNGDFSSGLTGWSAWTERGSLNQTVSNGQLQVQGVNHNGAMYQQFSTGGSGKLINISGFWESNPTVASSQWAEVLVINGTRLPVNGVDVNAGQSDVEMIYKNDTFATPGGWSGTMSATAPVANVGSFTSAGSVATILLKSGNTNGHLTGTRFDNIVVSTSGGGGPPPNQSPTAVASANPTSGVAPLLVNFNGTASSDPDLDPLTYTWVWGDGTANGSGATPSHTFTTPGTYNVTLTVNDGNGGTDNDSVSITATSGGLTVAEDFNAMPSWSSTFNAPWGGAAGFGIVGGGQAGSTLEAARSVQGSSSRVKVYNISPNTSYTISLYMRGPFFPGAYWAEAGYRLGSHTASNFDSSGGSWTLIKKFDNAGANGNGNTWMQYSKTFNSGASTQISVGYKLGSSGGGGPNVQWDTLRIQ